MGSLARADREDVTAQLAARQQAAEALAARAQELAWTSKAVASVAERRHVADLTALHSAYRALVRAEEALDLAQLDLDTARGADA